MKSPLDDGGPLQTADDEGVRLGPLRLHQLTFWKSHRDRCAPLTQIICFRCVKRVMKASRSCVSLATEKLLSG